MKKALIPQYDDIKDPPYIWYADKPITMPNANVRKISVQELEAIIGNGFRYSDNTYTTEDFKVSFNRTTQTPSLQQKVLHRLRYPLYDKLVICNMGNELGHGVFAREKIEFGEIVATYPGILIDEPNEKTSRYSIDVGNEAVSNYSVDASAIGGMARFFQHFPFNPDETAETLLKKFRSNPALIEQYFDLIDELSQFNEEEKSTIFPMLRDNVLNGNGEHIFGMVNAGKSDQTSFELMNLESTFPSKFIAFANIAMNKLVQDNKKPVMYFFAQRDIGVGEPIGFSYVLGYWAGVNRLPLLLYNSGNMIAQAEYKYRKMPFVVKLANGKNKCVFYTREQYHKAMSDQQSVQVSAGAKPMSFFKVRKRLAKNNVIAPTHLPLATSAMFDNLKQLMPDDVKAEMYNRFPDAVILDEQYIIDIVFRAKTRQRWVQLHKYFHDNDIIGIHCRSQENTGEVIIRGANQIPKLMFRFVQSKNLEEAKRFFEVAIAEENLGCKGKGSSNG